MSVKLSRYFKNSTQIDVDGKTPYVRLDVSERKNDPSGYRNPDHHRCFTAHQEQVKYHRCS